jgi:alpha-D-ribose 1-methylphosphonate 5-triphosphate synthase subunit PhnH
MTMQNQDNQKNYRRLLRAMSRPGCSVHLETSTESSPQAEALAIGRCLLDHEVSLCVIGRGDTEPLQAGLMAATQVRAETVDRADFIFVLGHESHGGVSRAKRGSPESPEEGATLVYFLDFADPVAGESLSIRLSGPGIAEREGILPEIEGISRNEYEELIKINADYPLGVDLFVVRAGAELIGIPRSTRIEMR